LKKLNVIRHSFFLLLISVPFLAFSQKLKKQDKLLLDNLQRHIHFLADDRLQGRRAGSAGERIAAEYISKEFQALQLKPQGTQDYFQVFEINEGKEISTSTQLQIDGVKLELNKDFFPLATSPDISLEALPSLSLQEPGMPWFYDLRELLEENASNPHFDIHASIINSTRQIKNRGGNAVFLYNTSTISDGLKFNAKDRSEKLALPVIYISQEMAKRFFSDPSASLDIRLKSEIKDRKRSAINVIGYQDNGATSTVVLGAHYDHLGFGEDGNSRETNKTPVVHNGADDNASGTAALIELARLLKDSKNKKHNYLFIAFSGEELGLHGSKYFTEHPGMDLASVNYMINMDMIGRLNDSARTITVGGYGTSPAWGELYGLKGKKGLYNEGLRFRFDSSGTGPSDHTSFYIKNIPVLFYFTGLHADYHKPSDDFEKINYLGELHVIKHIHSLVESTGKLDQKLVFTKTREVQTTTSARFSVTLGVMPDYTFTGNGVRVDGVSDNRPAMKAGLKAGDVITALGEYRITTLESYMQALSKFKKGDRTKIIYNRGAETASAEVEF
jgi:hypothetical protein